MTPNVAAINSYHLRWGGYWSLWSRYQSQKDNGGRAMYDLKTLTSYICYKIFSDVSIYVFLINLYHRCTDGYDTN